MHLFKNNKQKRRSVLTKNMVEKSPKILCANVYPYLAVCSVQVANARERYMLDTEKLVTKAAKSKDLYIEPDFNFQTFNTFTIEWSVNDQDGQLSQGVILRVFSTDNDETVKSVDGLVTLKTPLGMIRKTSMETFIKKLRYHNLSNRYYLSSIIKAQITKC